MIQSNLSSAGQIATEMAQAADAIDRATQRTINRAGNTTLHVNERAQAANDRSTELSQAFNQVFRQTMQNIQSTAEAFERTDSDLQNQFSGMEVRPVV
jgi:type VII secretion effector (TIGR04197 family)